MTKNERELQKLLKKDKEVGLTYEEEMRVRQLSPHFHSPEKGCRIVPKQQGKILGLRCLTHKKDICRCGWEWHWHYGTYYNPRKYQQQKKSNKS